MKSKLLILILFISVNLFAQKELKIYTIETIPDENIKCSASCVKPWGLKQEYNIYDTILNKNRKKNEFFILFEDYFRPIQNALIYSYKKDCEIFCFDISSRSFIPFRTMFYRYYVVNENFTKSHRLSTEMNAFEKVIVKNGAKWAQKMFQYYENINFWADHNVPTDRFIYVLQKYVNLDSIQIIKLREMYEYNALNTINPSETKPYYVRSKKLRECLEYNFLSTEEYKEFIYKERFFDVAKERLYIFVNCGNFEGKVFDDY